MFTVPGPVLAGSVDLIAGAMMSNTRMNSDHAVDQRLTDLEFKASFAEDLVDHLSALVARQQTQIDWLLREVTGLREQAPAGESAALRSLRDELPPHY